MTDETHPDFLRDAPGVQRERELEQRRIAAARDVFSPCFVNLDKYVRKFARERVADFYAGLSDIYGRREGDVDVLTPGSAHPLFVFNYLMNRLPELFPYEPEVYVKLGHYMGHPDVYWVGYEALANTIARAGPPTMIADFIQMANDNMNDNKFWEKLFAAIFGDVVTMIFSMTYKDGTDPTIAKQDLLSVCDYIGAMIAGSMQMYDASPGAFDLLEWEVDVRDYLAFRQDLCRRFRTQVQIDQYAIASQSDTDDELREYLWITVNGERRQYGYVYDYSVDRAGNKVPQVVITEPLEYAGPHHLMLKPGMLFGQERTIYKITAPYRTLPTGLRARRFAHDLISAGTEVAPLAFAAPLVARFEDILSQELQQPHSAWLGLAGRRIGQAGVSLGRWLSVARPLGFLRQMVSGSKRRMDEIAAGMQDQAARYHLQRLENAALVERLSRMTQAEQQAALLVIARLVDDFDKGTAGHTVRVGELSYAIACEFDGTDREFCPKHKEQIRIGGQLHDCGKCRLRRELIVMDRRPTKEEWAEMCEHPRFGYEMAKAAGYGEIVLLMILQHHCKLNEDPRSSYPLWDVDGAGVLRPFRASEILMPSRIVAVADQFDALSDDNRSYKRHFSPEEVLAILEENRAKNDIDGEALEKLYVVLEKRKLRERVFVAA